MYGREFRRAMICLIMAVQTSFITAASSGESIKSSLEGIFSVKDFGALADGQTDDTAAIQRCIDAAAEKGGQVYLPPGRYLVKGSLDVKTGVVVKGVHEAPLAIEPLIGTIIMAVGGRDHEDAPALFEMGHSSTVTGLTVWHPEQKPDDIHPYPWTFHLTGFDNTVENITLINSYNGIRVGPENNVRHRIRSVYGCVLRRGLFVDFCTDIGRVENVQFHCHWWSAQSVGGNWDLVYKYMYENCEAFVFGRTDWEYVTNNFVFPAKIGFRFIKTEHGACNGHFTANGADACETSVLVEEIQPMGLLITGGQFVSFNGENPIQLVVAPTCTGSVRLVNCAFWGPSNHNALINGKGFVSFNDCYFSNSKKGTEKMPLIVAKSGRLQINNSSFATAQPSVELGPELQHAIIQGNNGVNGVRIINDAQRAIIKNNEEPIESAGQ
ncbi:MAG: glycosyl hydrolase family 28-related protein [Candidatus Hinthialibacter sp.]